MWEEALKISEKKYRELSETLSQVVFEIDFAGNIVYGNDAAFEMFGYAREDLGKVNALELIEDADKERVAGAVGKMMDGRSDGAIREYIAKRKDGTTFPVRAYTSLVVDDEDNRVGVRGILTDITEEKEAERIIKESEERYRDIFDNIDEIIYVVDPESHEILFANKHLKDAFGKDLVGGICYRELQDLDEPCEFCTDKIIFKNKGEPYTWEYHNPVLDRDYLITDRVIKWPDGRDVRFELAIDITKRKKAEERVAKINTELDGYAHTVSHDLKGPLSAIMLGVEMLADSLEGAGTGDVGETSEIVAIIDRNARNAQGRIEGLLALAKSGQEPGETSTMNVGEVVEEIIEERSHEIKEKGIEVDVSGDLGTVTGNPTQVRQVFSNLIRNAITHNHSEDPVIQVSYLGDDGDGTHRYLVRDNGPGIPEDIIDNVFLPFTRGEGGDTGIGLSIVERIVKVYSGEIRVYNDNGACFEFTLRDF